MVPINMAPTGKRANDGRERPISPRQRHALAECLAATYAAMLLSEPLVRRLGQTGSDVVGRVSGVLLAGLAVQFIFDGVRQAALFAPP